MGFGPSCIVATVMSITVKPSRLPSLDSLSRIITILTARTEGLGLNAAARTFQVSKKSILDWEQRLSNLKPTLILYSLLHQFIYQTIEGDEQPIGLKFQ